MDKNHSSPYDIGIVYRDLTGKDPKFKENQECPLCGSGSGPNKTPGLKLYKGTNSFYCFACQSGVV